MRNVGAWIGRILKWGVAGYLLTLAAVFLWTFLWPLDRDPPQGDVIICLGAGSDSDGSLGQGSRDRAETCAALYHAGAAPQVLFTGGPNTPGAPSAAAGMATHSGVPEAAILLEESAQSTLQNALFSLDMLEGDARLILVTEAFHLPRSHASFRLMGARDLALYPAGAVALTEDGRPAYRKLLREVAAIWFNLARYSAWRLGGLIGVPEDARIDWLH